MKTRKRTALLEAIGREGTSVEWMRIVETSELVKSGARESGASGGREWKLLSVVVLHKESVGIAVEGE